MIWNVKSVFWSSLRAIASVAFFLFIEYVLDNYYYSNLTHLPKWLVNIVSFLPKPCYPNDLDNVTELISIIAGVSGVILALFYPVLATILSTAYAKVHFSIRDLVLKENSTQTYLKELIFLTAFALCLLLSMSVGFYPGNLILLVVTYFSLVILYRIQKIGLGVYHLLEPSYLLRINNQEIIKSINSSTTTGDFWFDKGFQLRSYKQAHAQIENLAIITSLCSQDGNLREESFKEAISQSYFILQYYVQSKSEIPFDSAWFPNTYQHFSYFESDMTLRGTAKNTNTFIYPKAYQNRYWFEEKVLENITATLSKLRGQNLAVLSDAIRLSHLLIDSLSASFDLRNTINLLDALYAPLKNIKHARTSKDMRETYDSYKHELSSVDAFCQSISRSQLAFIETILEFDSDKLEHEFAKIDWSNSATLNNVKLIPELVEQLNSFHRQIQSEYYVERRRITPDWYFLQLMTSVYLASLTKKFQTIIDLAERYFLSLSQVFTQKKIPLLSSLTAHLGLEILFKIRYRLPQLKQVMIDLDDLERCKNEFPWDKPDLVKITELLDSLETRYLSFIANDLELIQPILWNNRYPDIFAQSYSVISSSLNKALSRNSIATFKEYFERFVKSSIMCFSDFKTNFSHIQNQLAISYQLLIDIMELSGFAYLYDRIYNTDQYWPAVVEAWDKSFLPTENNIELLTSYYRYYRKRLHGTGINYNEKHEREATFFSVLNSNPQAVRNITDPLTRIFLPKDHYTDLFYQPTEIFIELYLFTFLTAKSSLSLIDRRVFDRWMWTLQHP